MLIDELNPKSDRDAALLVLMELQGDGGYTLGRRIIEELQRARVPIPRRKLPSLLRPFASRSGHGLKSSYRLTPAGREEALRAVERARN